MGGSWREVWVFKKIALATDPFNPGLWKVLLKNIALK